jgi:hypothetical protein
MAAAIAVAGQATLDGAGAFRLVRTLVLLIIDELPREQQWPLVLCDRAGSCVTRWAWPLVLRADEGDRVVEETEPEAFVE